MSSVVVKHQPALPPSNLWPNLIGFSQPQRPVLGWQLYQQTNNRAMGGGAGRRLWFWKSHQLTVFQRVDQLCVLAGEDGSRQVQHHTHRRQQHEERDLSRRGKGGEERGWRQECCLAPTATWLRKMPKVKRPGGISELHAHGTTNIFIRKDFLNSASIKWGSRVWRTRIVFDTSLVMI